MARERKTGRGIVWADVGALVLLAGVIAIVVSSLSTQTAPPTAPPSPAPSTEPSTPAPTTPCIVVAPSVSENGWTPEPITTDPDLYMARVLSATAIVTDSVLAEMMRSKMRGLLTKYDYPPNAEEKAVELVLEQTELFANGITDK